MTELELLDAIRTGIEALSAEPLKDFEVYVTDPIGRKPDERLILNVSGGEEAPRAMRAATGVFDEFIGVEMRAEFPAKDTDANRDKAFNVLKQLKQYVRDNRRISAGGDTALYAGWENPQTGFTPEGTGENERAFRFASLVGRWKIPSETS